MPSGDYQGLVDERFRGMDSAQVFNILLSEQPEQPELPEKPGQGRQCPPGVGTQAGTPQQGHSNTTGNDNTPVGFDDHDWDGAQQLTEEEKKELDRQIDQGIRQGVLAANKMRGSGQGGHGINLDALLKPQVDWRDVLREFVTATCSGNDYSTYNRPNRRYMHAGMYLPSGISETVEELVFAVDTSGSCFDDRELTGFMSEVVGVVETVAPERVRILYWGSYLEREEVYAQGDYDDLAKATKPVGGGGTNVGCVVDHIKENKIDAQAVIVLTDGYLGSGS
jgi:predicted metal-dependent peptidase